MAIGRPQIVSDEEVLARARAVFLERGYSASTLRIAAAVGLSWGAIARRFQGKRQLFVRCMGGPMFDGDDAGRNAAAGTEAELRGMLAQLGVDLSQRWPQQLQFRLATPSDGADARPDPAPDRGPRWLPATLAALARRGEIRSDVDAEALAQLVLTLLVGDVAQRFMARSTQPAPDDRFIDRLVCLLGGG